MTARHSIFDRLDNSPAPSLASWPARRPPSLTMVRARAELEAQAIRTARAVIKGRARAYALKPRDLDAIAQGLFNLSPRDLVVCLGRLIGIMRISKQPRWAGFGGEIQAINLRGAMIYARWSRRIANRIARRSA